CGTRIEVLLQEPITQGEITKLITYWCRRVEFPIIVNDLGLESTITAETSEQFVREVPDVNRENATISVRAFPINHPGIEGDLYIFAQITEKGESWVEQDKYGSAYVKSNPRAIEIRVPPDLTCLHGIT